MSGRLVRISVSCGGVPKTAVAAARVTIEDVDGPAGVPGSHVLSGERVPR